MTKTKVCKKCGCKVQQLSETEFSSDMAVSPALSHETLATLWHKNECPRCFGQEHLVAQ